jgi:hypothetical protein
MKAITTRYIGQTNHRPARIIASDSDGNRVTLPYDGLTDDRTDYLALNEDPHRKAAKALCAKMGWTGRLVAGGVKDGYVFVFLEE